MREVQSSVDFKPLPSRARLRSRYKNKARTVRGRPRLTQTKEEPSNLEVRAAELLAARIAVAVRVRRAVRLLLALKHAYCILIGASNASRVVGAVALFANLGASIADFVAAAGEEGDGDSGEEGETELHEECESTRSPTAGKALFGVVLSRSGTAAG
jgi:hypothetical protein